MNEQLEKIIEALIEVIKEQCPLLLDEVLRYELYKCSFVSLVMFILSIIVFSLFIKEIKLITKIQNGYIVSSIDSEKLVNDIIPAVIGNTIVLATTMLLFIAYFVDVLKILVAPKLFLLDYFTDYIS